MATTTKLNTRRERALASLEKTLGGIALAEEREKERRRAAIAATIDDWLEDLPPGKLIEFFMSLEEKATTRNRKIIQSHPARPSGMEATAE